MLESVKRNDLCLKQINSVYAKANIWINFATKFMVWKKLMSSTKFIPEYPGGVQIIVYLLMNLRG